MPRNPHSKRHAGRERRPHVSGSYNSEAGVWLVPVSDAWLNLVSRHWSPPVQLKAETADGGESYTFRVRPGRDALREVAYSLEREMFRLRELHGPELLREITHAVERGFGASS